MEGLLAVDTPRASSRAARALPARFDAWLAQERCVSLGEALAELRAA